jgi:tetratricopeptide (TPR) repeat protein
MVVFILQTIEAVNNNRLSLLMLKGTFQKPTLLAIAYSGYQIQSRSDCQAYWMSGKAADLLGKEDEKQTAWIKYLECSATSISILRSTLPMDVVFINKAMLLYPDNMDTLYWFAGYAEKNNPVEAIRSYNRIVQINSSQALAWCRLGNLYEREQSLNLSLNAYIQCCINNDPGYNGCEGAGRVMEKLGNPLKAIQYYRLSRWQGVLDRADELEKQLQP